MKLDKEFILKSLKEILSVDSPSGYTKNVINKLKNIISSIGYELEVTNNGTGIVVVNGKNENECIGFSSHVDTLGLMVKSISNNGRIKFTRIGGTVYASLNSELCKIYTRENKVYTGTIFSTKPSSHVYKDIENVVANEDTLEVILDENVSSKQDVLNLGISNGDIIAIDPKTVITDNGFIKSRFLDDKLSVAALIGVLKYIKDNNILPRCNIKFIFSVYEEVRTWCRIYS